VEAKLVFTCALGLPLDFWMVDTFHYENPHVTHLNEMVVIVYTNQQTYYAGTTNQLNKLLSDNRSIAGSIDIQTTDTNQDGRSEQITVNVGLTGVRPADIKSVVFVQSFSYEIQVRNQLKFFSPI